MNSRIKDVLVFLDPPKGTELWHGGPTLMGSLRSVKANIAARKPAPARNSIWELVLHLAYWKYNIIHHLNPDSTLTFDRGPVNFPALPDDKSDKNWKADKAYLKKIHEELIREVKNFPAENLDDKCPTKKHYTFAQLITGITAHDVYHIAQIQLLKKLFME